MPIINISISTTNKVVNIATNRVTYALAVIYRRM